MANKNFNTQIRKKFDSGSGPAKKFIGTKEKTKLDISRSKRQIDKNPGKNMSDKDKANLEKAMERRRLFNEKRKLEKQQKQIDGLKRKKTSKAKLPARPIGKPPLKKEPLRKPEDRKENLRDKVSKVKDKLKKVGDMKVKDAAKAVGKGILAATPVGAVKNAADTFNKNFKVQSPIVRKNRKFGGR